jgi:predicted dehydrogenase
MQSNRRQFIRNSSAMLALTSLKASGLESWGVLPKRRVALIGTGWYGKSDLFRLMQVAAIDVVGLCDVDKNQLKEASTLIGARLGNGSEIPLFTDYQKLLQSQQPEIVLIGSPDHWHALQAIDAMKAGAHVYLQKPISVDVIEGAALVAAAKKYRRVVQVGTQRRSTPHLIEAKQQIVDAGLLGNVHHAEICCYYHMRNNGNPPIQAVPASFDYESWTGPAPLRPYDGLPHRGWWRAFMEYGNGIMGDMCIHMFDTVRWMLNLGWPNSISSTGGIYTLDKGKSNIADTQTAIFAYDGFNCVWQHRTWGAPADPDYPWAFKIYGEKGTLCGSPMKYDFFPAETGAKKHGDVVYEREKFPEDGREKDIELHAAPATRMHMQNFLHSIDQGIKPVACIEEGHISTASCILANLSMQLGRPLRYDAKNMVVTGDAEATALLQRPYRTGFRHPHPVTTI